MAASDGKDTDPKTPPWAEISEGLAQDFQKWPRVKAKLWWLLVASSFTLMTTLAVVLTALWQHDHNITMDEMQQVYVSALDNFNGTFTHIGESVVKHIQGQLVRRARERIQEYMRIPELVVTSNIRYVKHGFGLFTVANVSRTMEVLWVELLENHGLSDNTYADDSGVYIGYEHIEDTGYTVIYRPPDSFATSPFVCPTCPPSSELRPAEKGYWLANNETGRFGELVGSHYYDVRTRPWYKLAKEANGAQAWTKPYPYTNGMDFGFDCVQAHMVNGRPQMVFDSSITLRFLTDFLTRVHRDLHQTEYQFRNAVTFIVDTEGLMIASSRGLEQVLVAGENPDSLRRRTWRELPGYSTRAALERLNRTGLSLPLPTSSMFPDAAPGTAYPSLTIFYEGGPYLCAYGTLTFPKLGLSDSIIDWIIVSIVRREVYMRPVDHALDTVKLEVNTQREQTDQRLSRYTRRTTLFGFALTLVGGAIMACVARHITMPIRKISKEMRAMAELKFMDVDPDSHAEEFGKDVALECKHTSTREYKSQIMDSADEGSEDENVEAESSDGSSSVDSEADVSSSSSRRCRRCPMWRFGIPVAELVEMRRAFASMSSGLQSFAKYVDPHVVELLVRGRAKAQLGVAKADVTIFFSDIANFTTMGEILKPDAFMDLLSEYLEEMSNIIMRTKGVVGEYIGDGIMAWWNTPLAIGERHTVQALTAALEQQRRLASLRRRWCARGLPEVHARMGLTRGMVLAGNVGSRRRMKFGLVGDSVNLASRLECLCKRYGVSTLVDASVHDAPGVADSFLLRPLDLVVVKGRSGTTELFEPVAAHHEADESLQSFVDDFKKVLALYRAGEFRGALGALDVYQQRWPSDKPAEMVRERCRALLASPPGTGWTPVETLCEK